MPDFILVLAGGTACTIAACAAIYQAHISVRHLSLHTSLKDDIDHLREDIKYAGDAAEQAVKLLEVVERQLDDAKADLALARLNPGA